MDDVYLEIAKNSDVKTILSMLSVNKKFNNEKFFKDIILRKYPNLIKYRIAEDTWKNFFLKLVYFISKLEEEYKYDNSLHKNPEKIYRWYKLLEKFDKWRNLDVPEFELYGAMNVYDLLYNPIQNGNHDTLSSYLINEGNNPDDMGEDYFVELHKLTPEGIFGEESDLFELTRDLEPVDKLMEHSEYVPYDYEYLLYILNKNGKTFNEYKEISGNSEEFIKEYPKLYVEKLLQNPVMKKFRFLKSNIRNKTNRLIEFSFDDEDGYEDENEDEDENENENENENEDKNEDKDELLKELLLTDDEIDLILELHNKVINFEISILTEVTPENLA